MGNFNNDVNSAHLHSQDYAICIRREVGNCCIEYSVCEDPNSFSIDNTRYELFTFMEGFPYADGVISSSISPIASMNLLASSTCTRDWIEINDSSEECNGNLQYNKYCGFTFSTEIASETDQIFQSEGDDDGEPYFPVDQDTLQPLSEILNRPHRTICDCTTPFNVGVRTSNEFRGIPPVPVANIQGQNWDQEVPELQARGVCLNYKQTPCA